VVEIDYYANYWTDQRSLAPLQDSLTAVQTAFANAPVSNLNGVSGINLIFWVDDAINTTNYTSAELDLWDGVTVRGGWKDEFLFFRNKYFKFEGYFHWCLFADSYANTSSMGVSYAVPSDSFLMAIGPTHHTRAAWKESPVLMHELGHNLGLNHSGRYEDVVEKPNYLSVMNSYYSYFDYGLRINGVTNRLDYSRLKIAAIDEASLSEGDGFSAVSPTTEADLQSYGVYLRYKGWIDTGSNGASANLDFNKNGTIEAGLISADINGNGNATDSFSETRNDWEDLIFLSSLNGDEFHGFFTPEYVGCFFD
jgi:hypothetical protein